MEYRPLIALNVISGMATEAKNSKGVANAKEMTRLTQLVQAAGGTVAGVSTGNAADAIADLKLGIELPGTDVLVKLEGNPLAASYTVATTGVWSFTAGQEP